ncbi:MAG: hypothetical protein R3F53_21680 [Gammaproteobacteria bacterium]
MKRVHLHGAGQTDLTEAGVVVKVDEFRLQRRFGAGSDLGRASGAIEHCLCGVDNGRTSVGTRRRWPKFDVVTGQGIEGGVVQRIANNVDSRAIEHQAVDAVIDDIANPMLISIPLPVLPSLRLSRPSSGQ